jgi:hypothetical protein
MRVDEVLPRGVEDSEATPALLDDGHADKGSVLRYALVGAVTACAYGGWVALLDYL